jgi:hypothetical protein
LVPVSVPVRVPEREPEQALEPEQEQVLEPEPELPVQVLAPGLPQSPVWARRIFAGLTPLAVPE